MHKPVRLENAILLRKQRSEMQNILIVWFCYCCRGVSPSKCANEATHRIVHCSATIYTLLGGCRPFWRTVVVQWPVVAGRVVAITPLCRGVEKIDFGAAALRISTSNNEQLFIDHLSTCSC